MPLSDRLRDRLDARFYPGVGSNWDDELFRQSILAAMGPDGAQVECLDLGAGAGIVPQMNFRGVFRRVCGVDPDLRVRDNPFLDEGVPGLGEDIPYPDASFDVVVADNVLEHLDDPARVFREVLRVLRPGGRFFAKTANRRHYVPTVARLTPQTFHVWVNRRRGRDAVDTFPTRYRANTENAIRRLARDVGFGSCRVDLFEGRPEYLRTHPMPYVVGIIYERIVNRFEMLRGFRVVLISELTR